MLKKLLFAYLLTFISCGLAFAQQVPVTVTGLITTGKVQPGGPAGCGAGVGAPVITVTWVGPGGVPADGVFGGSGPGSNASGGVINCTDPCDTTIVHIVMSNIQWQQGADDNWVHGVFFPSNAGLTFINTSLSPANWTFVPAGCTGINGINPGSCGTNAGTIGGAGWYFHGPNPGCCPGGGTTPSPCDNWGDPTWMCGVPLQFGFYARICNNVFTGSGYTLKVRITADGNTGCWSLPDVNSNILQFTLATSPCGPLYPAGPVYGPITKVCAPAPDFQTTLTCACGNGNSVTWWTAAVGGTQVGSGSPFVYHSATCPSLTLYAQCCTNPSTCQNRQAYQIGGPGLCPVTLALDPPTVTQPTCTVPTGTIHIMATAGTSTGTVTYTISPGGTSNTTGNFPGLSPNSYTITAVDATGCSATASATINTATTGGPGPTVVSPVNYCVGAVAVPLTAPGTNDLWYTVATGGVGSATAPTPSTATAGTTSYWVSQNPTGTCESQRSQIDVIVTANGTITLTSAAATNNQTVCVNTAITAITYSTGGGVTGATVTGLPAGVTGTYSGGTNGTFTINGTPTATGVFNYTITPTGMTCGTPLATGTITVNTASTITLSSAATTNAQTVCISTPIINIIYSTGGGVTGATVTGLPAGVTGTYSGGTNGTFTISGTPTAAGTFNYTVTTSGGCGTPTATGSIIVKPNVTITLTSAATTNNQTVCVNTAISSITYSTANGATGATITGLPAGVTGTYSGGTNGTITISGTPTATGVFNYTVTTSGGCAPPTATGTITVSTAATLTLGSAAATTAQTLCINTAITNITYNVGGGATGATVTGLPTGVNGAYAGGVFTISGTPTVSSPPTFSYTVTTTGGCGTQSLSGTIIVNPNTTITLTSGSAAQTVCISTAITNIVYTTANGATGVTVTGLPAGVTGVYSGGTNGTVTISGTPTVSGPFNYTITVSGGCAPPTAAGTITVNPNATMTLTSAAGTDNQTVNINTPITNITYSIGSGGTGATVTGPLPAGVTGTFSGGVFTISGTPTVSGVFPYSVTTTGGCSFVTLSGTITINNLTTLTLTSAAATTSQTICINTALVNIVYTVGGGGTGASITAGALPAGVTGVYSGGVNGTFTISGTPTVSSATAYTYTVTTSGGVGTVSLSGTITVNPDVTITLTSAAPTANQTLCINTAISNIVYTTANGATGASITAGALPAGVTGTYSGGTNGTFTISGTPTVSSATPYAYTVTTSGGCTAPQLSGSITVNPNTTITLTSAPATAAQTVCINTPITNIVYTTANGATGASITAGVLPAGVTGVYSGGTNGTFTISGTPTASGPFNYTVTTTGGCTTPSLSGTITVNPASTIVLTSSAATTSQTLCINTILTNIVYTTGGGVTGATIAGLPAGVTGTYSGGTNGTVTIAGTPTVSGPFSYTVTTIGICGTPSLSGTITINPAATITLTSAAATTSQTICINSPLTAIVYSTANGVTGATVTGLPAGVTGSYSGGTNGTVTISGTPTVSGPFNYTVTTSGGCATASLNGSITVNANVTITLTSAAATTSQTLCINSPLTAITYSTANGVTGATVTGLPAGVTGAYSGGTNGTVTISGSPTVAGPFNYTVTTTGGCSTASLTGTITVNPATTITLTSAAATTSQTLCINTALTNIVYTTGTGATGATVTGLPAGVTGVYSGGTNGTVTISGTPTASGIFSYMVNTSGGCGTASLSGTITVNPNVTLTLSSASANATACINTAITAITYTAASGATGATVTGLPAGVTGTYAGGTFTISGSATVTGSFPYTVTTTGGCSTASQNGTITINPNATISLTSTAATTSQTICINTALTNIVYATANGATGATVTGLPAGVTGIYSGGTNGTVTISGTPTAAGTFNYTATTTGGCSTASLNGSITVTPAATIILTSAAATAAQTVCINTAITNIVYTTANGVTNVTVTGLPAGVTGVFAGTTFTISGTPTVNGPFAYTVTTVGGCATASLNGTITVNNNVTITLTSAAATTSQTICINSPLTNIVYTTANGATGATVTGLPAGVTGTYSGGTNGTFTIHGSPTVAGGPFNYMVTTTGGCSTASLGGSITVNPAATITLTSAAATTSQSVCINTAIANIVYTTGSGATGGAATGLPAGVTGAYAAGVFTISGTPTVSGTFNYTVTTSGGCGTASLSGTITVRPNMTITLSSAAATSNQTVCINTAITNITYNVSNATGASVSGLPAGVNGAYAAGVFTISGSPSVTGSFPYTVTATGGCGSASLSGTITVRPNVTLALTSSTATTNQTICANTAISNITYSTGNGATGATVTGLPAGVSGLYAGGIFTISGTATASGLFNYTVTTTGGCSTASLSGSINVVAIPAAPTVVSPVNYCPNDAAIPLSATGTNLLWYTTATGGTGSTTTPTPSTTTPGTTNYYVSQTTTVGSCEGPRAQIVVNVTNGLSVNIGADTTICQGDSVHFTPVVTPPAISYAWRSITPNVPNSTIDSLNTLGTTVHPVDNAQYVLRATSGGCSAEDTVKVNVRWRPIVDAGPNAAICLNDSTFLSATITHTTGTTGIVYAWTPTDSLTTPTNSLTTWAHPASSTWYKLTATTTSAPGGYGCDFVVFDSVKVVVQPVVHAFAGNDTIAMSGVPHQLHGTGGVHYFWSSPTATINNPNSQNATAILTGDANFFLKVQDAIGCTGYDSLFVKLYNGPTFYVPSAFTPDGDGLNDILRPIPSGISTITYFRVFNRYGELMFETTQYLKGWDGTFKGKPQPAGAYVWMAAGVDRNNHIVEMKGTSMIIR